MSAPKGERPITVALGIARSLRRKLSASLLEAEEQQFAELIRILKSRDASSDTPDTKRRRPAKKARR